MLLQRVQVRRTADKLLAQADAAESTDRPERSIQFLARYLRYRPSDGKTLARYGLLLSDEVRTIQDGVTALSVLDLALAQDPGNMELQRKAMLMSMGLNRYVDANDHAEAILAALPGDGEAQMVQGRYEESRGGFRDAIARYESSIASDAAQLDSYVRLALLIRDEQRDPERGDQVMDQMVSANPENSGAYLRRALYLMDDTERLDAAAADAERAVALAPDDADALLTAARLAIQQTDWQRGRGHLQHGIEIAPDDYRMYLNLAEVEYRAGSEDEARRVLEKGVQVLAFNADLKWFLADLLIESGEVRDPEDSSGRLISELSNIGYEAGRLGYLQGRRFMAREEWREAIDVFFTTAPLLFAEPALQRQVNLMLADCYGKVGDTDKQYEVFRQMSVSAEEDLSVRVQLARSLESQGKFQEALEQYRLEPQRSAEVLISIARMLIILNLQKPSDQRTWDEIETALAEAAAEDSDEIRVPLLRAEVLVARDRSDEARQLLEEARDAKRDRIELWTALVTLAERQNAPDRIAAILEEAQKQFGDRLELRLLQARYLSRYGVLDSEGQIDELARGLDQFSFEDQRTLRRGLAQAYLNTGDAKAALEMWKPLVTDRPRDLRVQTLTFELALLADDEATQKEALAQIQAIEGDEGVAWPYAHAQQLLWQVDRTSDPQQRAALLEQVRGLADQLAGRRSSWSRLDLLEARIEDLEGHPNAAIDLYLKAFQRGERDPASIRRALELLYGADRYAEALVVLNQIRDRAMLQVVERTDGNELFSRNTDYNQALAAAQEVVTAGSTDVRDWIWLGQIQLVTGRIAESEESFKRAVAVAENTPDALVALIQGQVLSGRMEAARQSMDDLKQAYSATEEPLALAQSYEATGQLDEARTTLEQAVAAVPNDPNRLRAMALFLIRQKRQAQAQPYLEQLAALSSEAPDDAEWAGNLLAVLLASEADSAQLKRAMELLNLSRSGERNLADEPIMRLRAQSRVLALQNDPAMRKQSIRILQEIVRREPSTSGDDQLMLAKLYEFEKSWPLADATYKQLLQNIPGNPQIYTEYILGLIRNQQYDTANTLLNTLDQLRPGTIQATQLRAMILKAQGKTAEAVTVLTQHAQSHPEQLGPIAALVEDLEDMSTAEQLLRADVTRRANSDPRAILALAEFLGRRGRTREGLDLCAPLWKTLPPDLVSNTCATILAVNPNDPAQIQRVERWVADAMEIQPNLLGLQITKAVLLNFQQRYDEAETAYRQILERDPKNVVALNNLAWLLAMRNDNPAEGLPLINQALEESGTQASMLDTRAVIQLAQGRDQAQKGDNAGAIASYDKAMEDLTSAISLTPEPAMYFHLAQAHLLKDQIEEARQIFEEGTRKGLTRNRLDPLERAAYDQAAAQLK